MWKVNILWSGLWMTLKGCFYFKLGGWGLVV